VDDEDLIETQRVMDELVTFRQGYNQEDMLLETPGQRDNKSIDQSQLLSKPSKKQGSEYDKDYVAELTNSLRNKSKKKEKVFKKVVAGV